MLCKLHLTIAAVEETAWHFKPDAITGIYRWRQPDSKETLVRVSFRGQGVQHDPDLPLDDDIERSLRLGAAVIMRQQDRQRSPKVMHSIDDYLSGHAWPLTLWTEIENR